MSPESWLWLALWRLPASRLPRVEGLLCTEEAWGLFETSTPPSMQMQGFSLWTSTQLHSAVAIGQRVTFVNFWLFLWLPAPPPVPVPWLFSVVLESVHTHTPSHLIAHS